MGQSALNLTGEALQSPIGHTVETIIGGKYAFNKLADLAQQYGAAKGATPVAPPATPTPSPIVGPQNTGGVPRPQMPAGTPAQTMDTLRQPMRPRAPPATPPVGGPAAQQADSFLSSIASKYGKPAATAIAESPVGRMAGAVLNNPVTRFAGSKAGVGLQLALHSGDLNSGEAEQIRLMHEKQDLERQQLANKHATEMTKYYSAKQKMGNQ